MIDPVDLRVFVYRHLMQQGLPPAVSSLALEFAASESAARGALASLGIGKTILAHPRTGEIWMAGPFAAARTPYEVRGGSVSWWANCAWDMLGIPFIATKDVRVNATCADCQEPMTLEFGRLRPPQSEGVVHFLLPAHRWYDDIGYT